MLGLNEKPSVVPSRRARGYRGIVWAIILIAAAIVGVSKGQQLSSNSKGGSPIRTSVNREIRLPPAGDDDKATDVRLRERTELTNQHGRFAKTGDRVTFYPRESAMQFRNLENLALKRVVRVIGDSNDASKIRRSINDRHRIPRRELPHDYTSRGHVKSKWSRGPLSGAVCKDCGRLLRQIAMLCWEVNVSQYPRG